MQKIIKVLFIDDHAGLRDSLSYLLEHKNNALKFYPPPPDTNSSAFAYDMAQYKWGKSVRVTDTARANLAIAQAVTDDAEMAKMFSEAFGMEISEKNTPASRSRP